MSALCTIGLHDVPMPPHRLFPDEQVRKFVIRCSRGCGYHVERLCDPNAHVLDHHPDLAQPGGPGTTVEFSAEHRHAVDAANDAVNRKRGGGTRA